MHWAPCSAVPQPGAWGLLLLQDILFCKLLSLKTNFVGKPLWVQQNELAYSWDTKERQLEAAKAAWITSMKRLLFLMKIKQHFIVFIFTLTVINETSLWSFLCSPILQLQSKCRVNFYYLQNTKVNPILSQISWAMVSLKISWVKVEPHKTLWRDKWGGMYLQRQKANASPHLHHWNEWGVTPPWGEFITAAVSINSMYLTIRSAEKCLHLCIVCYVIENVLFYLHLIKETNMKDFLGSFSHLIRSDWWFFCYYLILCFNYCWLDLFCWHCCAEDYLRICI